MDTSPHKSDFVHVNGITLHYLDWGGEGEPLLFLTGMGLSAHIYDDFAPRFTDKFRVLALTRRAHGDSDCPETGYEADTLIEDICQFLDALNIDKTILAGHSLAGVELTHFAGTYPERVIKLVYLDALDDRRGFPAIMEQNPLKDIEIPQTENESHTIEEYIANMKRNYPFFADIWSGLWDEEISHEVKVNENGIIVDRMPKTIEKTIIDTLHEYVPKKVEARIPTLSFYALGKIRLSDYYTDEQKALFDQFFLKVRLPFVKSLISEFQSRFPHARIVEIPDGHHYCFIAQEEIVYDEMRNFLLQS
jgi:pimeloyl-ACP methyl ester carboxylesterase